MNLNFLMVKEKEEQMHPKNNRTTIIIGLFGLFILSAFSAAAQNLQYVLKPSYQYSVISNYSEGLSRVEISADSTGFIDRSGQLILKLNRYYNDVYDFHNGMARVKKVTKEGTLYGYINKKGKLVIPLEFSEAKDFSDHRAMVYKDYWQVINRKGETVLGDSLLITEIHNDQGGYDVEPPSFHDGLLLTRRNGKYGYVDTLGKRIIPCQYDLALDFSDGAAIVTQNIPNNDSLFHSKKGNNEYVKTLDDIYHNLPGEDYSTQRMIINKKGKVVYTFQKDTYPNLQENFSDGIIGFYDDRKKGFVNTQGEIIVAAKYGNNPYPLPYSNGVSIIQIRGEKSDNSDGYMKLVDTEGKTISEIPFQTKFGLMYDSNLAYHEGLLAVKILVKDQGYLWGYMDKQGHFVIEPQFNKTLNFYEGRAVVVTQEGSVGIIKNPL